MNKKTMLSAISAIMSVFFIATLFAGFTMKSKAVPQEVTYNLGVESKSIDVSLNNSSDGSKIVSACFEGLTVIDPKGAVAPGVAKSWDISKDGLTYTFHLRNNAKWSDGKQVTAKDFLYSWQRLLNPKTAAEYAYQIYYLKNAEAFYNGKGKLEDVGMKVVDPLTFKVTLKAPTPYFLALCAFSNLSPIREDVVTANPTTWATSATNYIGNGPFKMVEWKHKDSLSFVKNTNYWNAASVKLDKLTFLEVTDNTAALEAWEKGTIDVIADSIPTSEIPRLIDSKKLDVSPTYSTYYINFNQKRYPMNNLKFRQALSLAINRQFIVKSITKAGQKPATAMVPFGSVEPNGKDFREYKSYPNLPAVPDVEKAKKLLKESGVNLAKLNITYIYNTESAAHKKIAEAVQEMWKQIGVNVKLGNMEFAVLQAARTSGNYDIARGGWNGDYIDPMTFLDMWTSYSGQNEAHWSNIKFDGLIAAAKKETNFTKRMGMMHQAEDLLMADGAISPLYFYVATTCINPKVKGVYRSTTGGIYFDKAYVQ